MKGKSSLISFLSFVLILLVLVVSGCSSDNNPKVFPVTEDNIKHMKNMFLIEKFNFKKINEGYNVDINNILYDNNKGLLYIYRHVDKPNDKDSGYLFCLEKIDVNNQVSNRLLICSVVASKSLDASKRNIVESKRDARIIDGYYFYDIYNYIQIKNDKIFSEVYNYKDNKAYQDTVTKILDMIKKNTK